MINSQSILILGCGSDIAKSVARTFAKHNFSIQLAGRNIHQMERLQQDLICRYGIKVTIHLFDAEQFQTHAGFVRALLEHPDVIIYSAGHMAEQTEAFENWETTEKIISVNYIGAISILNQFVKIFRERHSGCIIGLSSVAGDRGRQANYIYGSAKAAFSTYLSGLRNEMFAYRVRVITVKPGFVYTKMTQHLKLPPGLTATPEMVADRIFSALEKKKNIVYIKPIWRWIMGLIRIIPEGIFKRLKI